MPSPSLQRKGTRRAKRDAGDAGAGGGLVSGAGLAEHPPLAPLRSAKGGIRPAPLPLWIPACAEMTCCAATTWEGAVHHVNHSPVIPSTPVIPSGARNLPPYAPRRGDFHPSPFQGRIQGGFTSFRRYAPVILSANPRHSRAGGKPSF